MAEDKRKHREIWVDMYYILLRLKVIHDRDVAHIRGEHIDALITHKTKVWDNYGDYDL